MDTFQAYLDAPGLNFSTLKHAALSALHYQHARYTASKPTSAMRIGTLTHAIALRSESVDDIAQERGVVVFSGVRRGKVWTAFEEAHQGELIVTAKELSLALAMRAAVRRHKPACAELEGLTFEHTLTWTHEPTGMQLKGRVDGAEIAADGIYRITELKTTLHIAKKAFAREVATRLYHAQQGLYAFGAEVTGGIFPSVSIIAIENKAPHDVAVCRLGEDDLVRGYRMCEGWIRTVAEARRIGRFDGVAPEPYDLVLPDWASTGEDDAVFAVDDDTLEGEDE